VLFVGCVIIGVYCSGSHGQFRPKSFHHPRNICHDSSLDTWRRAKRATLYPGSSHGKCCVGGGRVAEIVQEGHRSTSQLARKPRTAHYPQAEFMEDTLEILRIKYDEAVFAFQHDASVVFCSHIGKSPHSQGHSSQCRSRRVRDSVNKHNLRPFRSSRSVLNYFSRFTFDPAHVQVARRQ
jgi:hypothetical protein